MISLSFLFKKNIYIENENIRLYNTVSTVAKIDVELPLHVHYLILVMSCHMS